MRLWDWTRKTTSLLPLLYLVTPEDWCLSCKIPLQDSRLLTFKKNASYVIMLFLSVYRLCLFIMSRMYYSVYLLFFIS